METGMKHALIIAVAFAVISISHTGLPDIESASLYNRANEQYTLKEYHKALDLYLELIDRGVQNPLLCYNLANTYYKVGRTGHAVLYYEKALLLKPFDRDIRANLTYVERNLADKIRPLRDEGFFRLFKTLSSFLKLKITVFIELSLFTLFIIIFHLYIFFPVLREKLKKPLIVSATLLILSFIGMLAHWSSIKKHPRGVILTEVVEVKSSPITESETLFTLHVGTKFRLIEKRGEWLRFSVADGRQGWTKLNTAALIETEYHKVRDAGSTKAP